MRRATPQTSMTTDMHTISIHALREESDGSLNAEDKIYLIFQSTLSVRRATVITFLPDFNQLNFNPRSPWGERRNLSIPFYQFFHFNPRSPWGERPCEIKQPAIMPTPFQSTLSVRRATSWLFLDFRRRNFNPRSPWGERHLLNMNINIELYFNPRSPWGERLFAFCCAWYW